MDDGVSPDQVANDGIYTASFSPTQTGNYNVTTGATGTATLPFSRESYDLVSVAQTTSTIGTGITDLGRDLNGNGLYDQLIIHVPLRLGSSIHYRLAGTLQDSAGNTLSASTLITTNASYAELVFDGATINQRGVNGPYTLTSLKLAEENGMAILPLQETTPNYKTVAYRYTQFEGQALSLNAAGNSAVGVDTNANGKYDLLRVSIGVNVQSAGYYTWSARLRDSTGKEIGLVSNTGSLSQGSTTVRLDSMEPKLAKTASTALIRSRTSCFIPRRPCRRSMFSQLRLSPQAALKATRLPQVHLSSWVRGVPFPIPVMERDWSRSRSRTMARAAGRTSSLARSPSAPCRAAVRSAWLHQSCPWQSAI